MKNIPRIVLVAAVLVAGTSAAEVDVSVGVSQPGFYGQISIGNLPRPQVIYAQPVIVRPSLMRFRPGHCVHAGSIPQR